MSGTLSTTEYVPGSSGGSSDDSGTTIVSGGVQYIGDQYGTGSATDTMIDSGGIQYLGDGTGTTGYATSTTISGAISSFYYSGVSAGAPIAAFQIVGVNSGTGIATSTSILLGGVQYVGDSYGTGTATDTTISGGEYTFVNGSADEDFSYQYVGYYNGTGTATGTTILSGGVQILGDATNNGDDAVGYATSTTIESGGVQDVGYELGTGYATGTIVDNGGVQNVGEGYDVTATAIGTILSGGTDYLNEAIQNVGFGDGASATAISTTIDADGIQYLGSGVFATGYATSTTISGLYAEQEVGFGNGVGSATDTIIYSGGNQTVGGQNIHGIGGTGYATSTTVYSGGEQTLGFVGTGYATSTILSGGVQQDGFTYNGIGYATDTTIDSGGSQYVGFQGTGYVTGTTINSGGVQYVGSYTGIGTATDTTIYSGGVQYVGHDSLDVTGTGMVISTTISGGTQYVSFEGTATDTTIYGGGLADILSGGVADDVIIDGGTLELAAGASIGSGVIDFAAISGANGGTLDLTGEGSGSSFTLTAAISGFTGDGGTAALSDIIYVAGAGGTDKLLWKQDGASGRLQVESEGKVLESLTLDGTYSQKGFVLTEVSATIDQITYNANAPCYVAGTLIATETGEIPIEDLCVGDIVVTASGERRPIVWIGWRDVDCTRHPEPETVWPVRIVAGAIRPGAPARDLVVSPGHSLFLEDVLVPAIHLVNGATVVQERVESVSYWHLELDRHDLLVAEGLAAESYLDCRNRDAFTNGGAVAALHPDFSPLGEWPADAHWAEENACAPRHLDGPIVQGIRESLARRAVEMGARAMRDPGVQVVADGEILTPVSIVGRRFSFDTPDGVRQLRLRSRSAVLAQIAEAESSETRRLGVRVTRIVVDEREFALDAAELADGWHEVEGSAFDRWRWSDGDAELPIGQNVTLWLHPLPIAYPLPLREPEAANGNVAARPAAKGRRGRASS